MSRELWESTGGAAWNDDDEIRNCYDTGARLYPGQKPGGCGQVHHKRSEEEDMKASTMFPSKYLNTGDLGTARPVVVIESLKQEEVGQDDDKEKKWVLYFRGKEKGLTLNQTNRDALMNLLGDETENWLGQAIRLYVDPSVMMSGKRVGGIRIEEAPQVVSSRTPPPRPAPAPAPVHRHVEPEPGTNIDDGDIPF